MTQSLDELLAHKLTLPIAPVAVTGVIRVFKSPDVQVSAVVAEVADDPVLTALLLRAANSVGYSHGRKISSPLDAVRTLGMDRVYGLVTAAAVQGSFHAVPTAKLDAVWEVSLRAADFALDIGALIGIDRATAYTAGLLHAVGMLVMSASQPALIRSLDEVHPPMLPRRPRLERAAFGFCYADAGAALLRHWGLPQRFVDALQHQFSPLDEDHHEVLAAVVCIAGWRARAEYCNFNEADMITSYPDEVGLLLGLDPDLMMASTVSWQLKEPVSAS